MRELLEEELSAFPQRSTGEQLYEFFRRWTERVGISERAALIAGVRQWLTLRSEPRTMLSVDIAAANHLHELRPDIEELLRDIREGDAFLPHYEAPVMDALRSL